MKEADWGPAVKGRSSWIILASSSLFPAPVLGEALAILETAWDCVLISLPDLAATWPLRETAQVWSCVCVGRHM